MTGIAITRHGEVRMRQRGIRAADLDLVLSCGTEIGRDRIMPLAQEKRETAQSRISACSAAVQ